MFKPDTRKFINPKIYPPILVQVFRIGLAHINPPIMIE